MGVIHLNLLAADEVRALVTGSVVTGADRTEYLSLLLKRHPLSMPYTSPMYSNIAYHLLGYALESMSGTNYSEAVAKSIFRPLQLNKTSAICPNEARVGVIPPGDSGWCRPLGDEARYLTIRHVLTAHLRLTDSALRESTPRPTTWPSLVVLY